MYSVFTDPEYQDYFNDEPTKAERDEYWIELELDQYYESVYNTMDRYGYEYYDC